MIPFITKGLSIIDKLLGKKEVKKAVESTQPMVKSPIVRRSEGEEINTKQANKSWGSKQVMEQGSHKIKKRINNILEVPVYVTPIEKKGATLAYQVGYHTPHGKKYFYVASKEGKISNYVYSTDKKKKAELSKKGIEYVTSQIEPQEVKTVLPKGYVAPAKEEVPKLERVEVRELLNDIAQAQQEYAVAERNILEAVEKLRNKPEYTELTASLETKLKQLRSIIGEQPNKIAIINDKFYAIAQYTKRADSPAYKQIVETITKEYPEVKKRVEVLRNSSRRIQKINKFITGPEKLLGAIKLVDEEIGRFKIKEAKYYVFDERTGGEMESNLEDYKYYAENFGETFLDKRGEKISKEEALSNIEEVTAIYNPQGIGIARNDIYDTYKESNKQARFKIKE